MQDCHHYRDRDSSLTSRQTRRKMAGGFSSRAMDHRPQTVIRLQPISQSHFLSYMSYSASPILEIDLVRGVACIYTRLIYSCHHDSVHVTTRIIVENIGRMDELQKDDTLASNGVSRVIHDQPKYRVLNLTWACTGSGREIFALQTVFATWSLKSVN